MDRIVYLAGGRAASGTTEEVVRTEVLSELYGHHVDVLRVARPRARRRRRRAGDERPTIHGCTGSVAPRP